MTEPLPGLAGMVEEVRRAGGVLAPSAFWTALAERNMATLAAEGGIERFKRSVNNNYFQWVWTDPREPDFRAALRHWARRPTLAPLAARVEGAGAETFRAWTGALPTALRPKAYALFVALVWELARRRAGAVADALEEPALGDPIVVRHRGRRISQDLANSLLEYATAVEHIPAGRLEAPLLLEIGGGYGRLTWLWLALRPRARAVLVDIPPALAIAQEYLGRLFPGRRVARFRPDADPERLRADVADADLAFLTPNQLEALAPLGADLALNVSSLHEMTREQIRRYLELVDVHARGGFFYTKQWIYWENPDDHVVAARETYPYPAGWRRVVDRVHPIQVNFFEGVYAL